MADDTKGLPDVDLSGVVADLEAQNQDKEPKQDQEIKDQFKDDEARKKAYKELQGFSTKVSQENKALKERLAALEAQFSATKEQQDLLKFQLPPVQQQNKNFDDIWMENPENAIRQKVMEQVNLSRIEEVLQDEEGKNQEEFQERYAYADMLAKNPQYAHLAKTPAGIRKLFELGDKLRTERLKTSFRKSLELGFGEPVTDEEIAKFKTIIKGNQQTNNQTNNNANAYMPDSSTSTMTGAGQNQGNDASAKIREAANKGDLDGVLNEMFTDILAE